MRRFTRLANAFSQRLENLIYALALFFVAVKRSPPPDTRVA